MAGLRGNGPPPAVSEQRDPTYRRSAKRRGPRQKWTSIWPLGLRPRNGSNLTLRRYATGIEGQFDDISVVGRSVQTCRSDGLLTSAGFLTLPLNSCAQFCSEVVKKWRV